MEMEMVNVTCPTCIVCGKAEILSLPAYAVSEWKEGAFAQRAFPEMPADQREMLISGTHPACWDELFSDAYDE